MITIVICMIVATMLAFCLWEIGIFGSFLDRAIAGLIKLQMQLSL